MATLFTPQSIRGLKPTDKRQEFRDSGADNLYVVVQPKTGEKSFVIRTMIEGKQRKKTLGTFPAMSLAEARDRAREIKFALKRGDAPPVRIGPAKPVLEPPRGMTVAEAWGLYWKHEGGTRKTANEKQRIFKVEVAPAIGGKLLEEVSSRDLANLIRAKFETAKTSSNRLHSLLARFFRWCVTSGQSFTNLAANPMASVVKMHSERDAARTRYFSKQELLWWFQALEAAGEYRPIHELLMRTLCRFSDIMNLTWGEVITHDNGDTILSINDTKNGQPHVVWLHSSAFKLLPDRPAGAKASDRVFKPASRSGKPVERMRKLMSSLAAAAGHSVEHWQPHDYRRTGTTHLAGMLDADDNPVVRPDVLDRLLAHKEAGVIRHYNRYAFYREKKLALKAWSDSLDRLTAPT